MDATRWAARDVALSSADRGARCRRRHLLDGLLPGRFRGAGRSKLEIPTVGSAACAYVRSTAKKAAESGHGHLGLAPKAYLHEQRQPRRHRVDEHLSLI